MTLVRMLLAMVVLALAATAWIVAWHGREAREAFEAESAILAGLAAGRPLDASAYLVEYPDSSLVRRTPRIAVRAARFERSLQAGAWRREPSSFYLFTDNEFLGAIFPPPRHQAVVTADGALYELTTYQEPGGRWRMLVDDESVPMDTTSVPAVR